MSKIIISNLDAINRAWEAFTTSENSEKIRRALSHNIRTSGAIRYITGDFVYYKRADSREWRGPAKVFGQDVQQMLIKNGSTYIIVHSYRLWLINQNSENHQDTLTPPYISNENDKHEPQLYNKINKNQHHLNIENSDSEDKDPSTRKSTNHHSLKQTIKDEIQDEIQDINS